MDKFAQMVEGLHPSSNAYREIQREHVFNMGVKAGKAYVLDQVKSILKGGTDEYTKNPMSTL